MEEMPHDPLVLETALVTERNVGELALQVVDSIPAMAAYWDMHQRCHFANAAYMEWFGRSRSEMIGISLSELLGPLLYELNLPHIQEALGGNIQTFERTIPLPDGRTRHALATYTPDVVEGKVQGFFVHVADVTALKELEQALKAAKAQAERLATHDYLTGLPNRALFQQRIAHALAAADRNARPLALMMIDMNGFKSINDTFGHAAGDRILITTAERMSRVIPESATLARTGGDEFILICGDMGPTDATVLAECLLTCVAEPVTCLGVTVTPSISIGIALYPNDGNTEDALTIAADRAMYRAKGRGHQHISFASGNSPVRHSYDKM